MDNLITALTILRKYGNPKSPTHCEHDVLRVAINPNTVSEEDMNELYVLGFHPDKEDECFKSFKYGSY